MELAFDINPKKKKTKKGVRGLRVQQAGQLSLWVLYFIDDGSMILLLAVQGQKKGDVLEGFCGVSRLLLALFQKHLESREVFLFYQVLAQFTVAIFYAKWTFT